jgi:hypothetical protein
MLVRGINNLNDHTPSSLYAIWRKYEQESVIKGDLTTTVYHFGFSEATGLMRAFAYRSTAKFKSEELPYSIGTKPVCSVPQDCRLPEDIPAMMREQRSIQARNPKSERLYIGGEIQIHHLSKDGCCIYTLHRFDDYDDDEKVMFSNFRRDK